MPREATLDLPDDELRGLLDGALALALREIDATRNGPVFVQTPSAEHFAALRSARLPIEGESVDALLAACKEVVDAGRRTTPRFFGYVLAPASPVGIAADLIASAANQNVTAWRSSPAATEIEQVVLRWLGQLVGYGEDAAGIMVSGGSHANLAALLVALHARVSHDADRRRCAVYVSPEAHFSSAKAAAILGLRVRPAAVGETGRIDPQRLREMILNDRADGLEPVCLVASAGTTGTGVIDPLGELAAVAAEADVWLHVDGAYGALAAADPASRDLFAGMDRADSLAIDAHKWLAAPLDCGALLVKDAAATHRAFSGEAGDYVRVIADDAREAFAFWDHGIELSRRFRALKLWMTLRYYGARRIGAVIAEDIALTRRLAELVAASDDFELLSGAQLSICCFRHVPSGMNEADLNAHNAQLLTALQRDGRAYLSNLEINGRFSLRACITNFRTTHADIEQTVSVARELAARINPAPGGQKSNQA